MQEGTTQTVSLSSGTPSDVLTEILREGAQRMLATAIEAEAADWIERHSHVLDEKGHRQVVRNGYLPERKITTGLGEIEVKALTDNGYEKSFAAAVATSASVLGPIIPPSIPMIIYAAMTEQSVGKLFLGGIIPGLLMAGSLMVLIYFISKKRIYPKDVPTTSREKMTALKDAIIPILMPVIMLGGIASGIFTPTEAAAVAAFYALIVSLFVYRTVRVKDLPKIFVNAMITSAVITFIISNTSAMSFLLTVEEAGIKIASAVLSFSSNKW